MHTPNLPLLVETLLQHLEREEVLLHEVLANDTAINTALRTGDLNTAAAGCARQEVLADKLEQDAPARSSAIALLAREVGLDQHAITLRKLADHLPSTAARRLLDIRAKIEAVTIKISEIQAENAILIAQLRSFFRGVFSGLAVPEVPARYGPSGSQLEVPTGLALQVNG